jgi:hypothetical protein
VIGANVTRKAVLAIAAFLISQQAAARHSPTLEARAAFREAVEDYQIFVVPRCAPDDVRDYVAATSERDQAFVHSLSHTKLKLDYEQAVQERAAKDERIVFHCFGPPPPPPPPIAAEAVPVVAPSKVDEKKRLAEFFRAGDRQFATMVRLRDAAIGPR